MSQQIYLPLSGRYPIPYEFEADTMPVPRGHFQCPLGTPRRESHGSTGNDLSFLESRKHMDFRCNVVYVESLCVKETWHRHVAMVRQKNIRKSLR